MDSDNKKKKGRPRKTPLPINENGDFEIEPKEKKKRGRKKKEVDTNQVKTKKKRGRKAAVKYFSSSFRKQIPLSAVIQDSDTHILHINVKDNDEDKEDDDNDIEKNNVVNHSDLSFPEQIIYNTISQTIMATSDGEVDNFSNSDISETDSEHELKQMYEKRIRMRENQDKILQEKLETLHMDQQFFENITQTPSQKHEIKKDASQSTTPTIDISQEDNKKKGFFQLLYKIVENKEWLHQTDIACWWCCHPFTTTPIGLPINYKENTKRFIVHGVFCSFACTNAYSKEHRKNDKHRLIHFLHKTLTGIREKTLPIAPPRCALKMFGGELTIEEFRKSSEENKIYKMVEYPMIPSRDYVEIVDIANVKNANTTVFGKSSNTSTYTKSSNRLDEKRVHDAKLRLSSQVQSATKTVGNTIDKFLKLN